MDSPIRILVLEDDPEWFEIIQEQLGEEYELTHARNLDEADDWLSMKTFRLVIVDLNLKDHVDLADRSGFLLIDELSGQEILRNMSIVVLSRFDDSPELRHAFKDLKVFDFISKKEWLDMPIERIVRDAVAASYGGVSGRDL
jgi:DNA-binding response OmpR family regulator